MAYSILSSSPLHLIDRFASIRMFISPAHASGAGDIPTASGLDDHNWRHGDGTDLLMAVPLNFKTKKKHTDVRSPGSTLENGSVTFVSCLMQVL